VRTGQEILDGLLRQGLRPYAPGKARRAEEPWTCGLLLGTAPATASAGGQARDNHPLRLSHLAEGTRPDIAPRIRRGLPIRACDMQGRRLGCDAPAVNDATGSFGLGAIQLVRLLRDWLVRFAGLSVLEVDALKMAGSRLDVTEFWAMASIEVSKACGYAIEQLMGAPDPEDLGEEVETFSACVPQWEYEDLTDEMPVLRLLDETACWINAHHRIDTGDLEAWRQAAGQTFGRDVAAYESLTARGLYCGRTGVLGREMFAAIEAVRTFSKESSYALIAHDPSEGVFDVGGADDLQELVQAASAYGRARASLSPLLSKVLKNPAKFWSELTRNIHATIRSNTQVQNDCGRRLEETLAAEGRRGKTAAVTETPGQIVDL